MLAGVEDRGLLPGRHRRRRLRRRGGGPLWRLCRRWLLLLAARRGLLLPARPAAAVAAMVAEAARPAVARRPAAAPARTRPAASRRPRFRAAGPVAAARLRASVALAVWAAGLVFRRLRDFVRRDEVDRHRLPVRRARTAWGSEQEPRDNASVGESRNDGAGTHGLNLRHCAGAPKPQFARGGRAYGRRQAKNSRIG